MQKRTFEELVRLHQDGAIGWRQFVEMSDDAGDYRRWCDDHALIPDDDNAELYLKQTESLLTLGQIDPEDYEQLQKSELAIQRLFQ